jgi:hypothetical protein
MSERPPRKPWWHSRMLWLNVAAGAFVAAEAGWGVVRPHVTPEFWAWFALALGIVNAVLRVVTTQALTLRKPE